MDDSLSQALIRLRRGAVRRLEGGRGSGIAVFEGQVWVTQDGDPRDTILESGESHAFDRDGDVVVQAFADAVLIRYQRSDGGHDRLPSDAERPLPRISAYALMRVTRAMRHAALARALIRAAGAVVFAGAWLGMVVTRWLSHRPARHAGPPLARHVAAGALDGRCCA